MSQTCRAANLRPLLQDTTVQRAIEDVITAYSRISNEDPRGTRVRDAFTWMKTVAMEGVPAKSAKSSELELPLYRSLLNLLNTEVGYPLYVDRHTLAHGKAQHFVSQMVISCEQIHIGGVRYKPHLKSSKDCNVVYYGSDQSSTSAGQITQIFLHTRSLVGGGSTQETFIAIQPLSSLSKEDQEADPYRRYKLGGGFLCYDNLSSHSDVVRPSSIISHFAKTPVLVEKITAPCIHVLPLDRVRHRVDSSPGGALTFQQLLKLADLPPPQNESEGPDENQDQVSSG